MPDTVVVLGTLDSKSSECAYLRDRLSDAGWDARLLDVGVLEHPGVPADITREAVAAAADADLQRLRADADRRTALDAMGQGAGRILERMRLAGELDGVIALGGSGGTAVAAAAMTQLPLGFPRIIVSTVAAMDVRDLVTFHDIVLWPSTTDLAGLNAMSRRTLGQAAAALTGMLQIGDPNETAAGSRTVAVTALGLTTAAATAARHQLERAGCEVVVFHATGMGGDALETLAEQGSFDAVLDLTLVEMADTLFGGAGPSQRPRPVLNRPDRPVPRVLVPGGLDMIKFAGPETIPAACAGQPIHRHSASVTLVRVNAEQAEQLGRLLAERVRDATDPVQIVYPAGGFSEIDRVGEPFHDPVAAAAFRTSLEAGLRSQGSVLHVLDLNINEPQFGAFAAQRLLAMLNKTDR